MKTFVKVNDGWIERAPENGEVYKRLYPEGSEVISTYRDPDTLVEPIRRITTGAFRRRFTLEEKIAIESSTDPVVKVLDKDLASSAFVDLDFLDTIDGIRYFASKGLIKPERVDQLREDGLPHET